MPSSDDADPAVRGHVLSVLRRRVRELSRQNEASAAVRLDARATLQRSREQRAQIEVSRGQTQREDG